MRDIQSETRTKLKITFYVLILILFVLILTGKQHLNDFFLKWGVSIITSILLMAISQAFVQGVTGDVLEKLFLNINIAGKKYSISFFVIVTVIVRYIVLPLLGI